MSETMTRAMCKKVRVTEGKHQGEPTCDNCLWMTIIKSGSGNHRHCDQMGLYIPDWEMYPSCSLHHRMNATSLRLAQGKREKWETETVTDPKEIARVEKKMVRRKEVCYE